MTEQIFYPDAHIESTSVDGFVGIDTPPSPYSWADSHDHAGDRSEDEGSSIIIQIRTASGSPGFDWYQFYRGIVVFDISGIPSGSMITAATLSLYGVSKTDPFSISPTINIFSANPASNIVLVDGDYASLGTIGYYTAITFDDFSTIGYNVFTLNTIALTALQTALDGDSIIKLGIREATYDAPDSEPTWVASRLIQFTMYASEQGSGFKPKLTVTYTGEIGYGADRTFITGVVYPVGTLTRVTSITHRYDRGIYSVELALGDVTSDFGVPEVDTEVKKSYEPREEDRALFLENRDRTDESGGLGFFGILLQWLDIFGIFRR